MFPDTPAIIFWFRRDFRLEDNAGLYHALKKGLPVIPLFIFDKEILDRLEDKRDRRVSFIHRALQELNEKLQSLGSTLVVRDGTPEEVWEQLLTEMKIAAVYANEDYEPAARKRDRAIGLLLEKNNITFHLCKDQVVFSKEEVVKDDGKPYTVFTPFKNKWRAKLTPFYYRSYPTEKYFRHFFKSAPLALLALADLGFSDEQFEFPENTVADELIRQYSERRDIPALPATSKLGLHLRFGTVSIRKLVAHALPLSETWVNELIWREFFMQILWHFPHVVTQSFRAEYDRIAWRNDENEFRRWCEGRTGYPLVDAGMRELNATGFMHNRVRMVTASFLVKHLLIDWRWGEAYFAVKLLDYDLSANNGNWQWAAGTGTDAAPYFRVFNPTEQQKKFDPEFRYIRQWLPEFGTAAYPAPMVEHAFARDRCLQAYKQALGKN